MSENKAAAVGFSIAFVGFLLFLLVVALFGCAHEIRAYVTVSVPPHDELAWFADGPEMICWIHNKTDHRVVGRLHCLGDHYTAAQPISLEAGEERMIGACQVMNRDVHAGPCWIDQ
jgi:hypothetical protein